MTGTGRVTVPLGSRQAPLQNRRQLSLAAPRLRTVPIKHDRAMRQLCPFEEVVRIETNLPSNQLELFALDRSCLSFRSKLASAISAAKTDEAFQGQELSLIMIDLNPQNWDQLVCYLAVKNTDTMVLLFEGVR